MLDFLKERLQQARIARGINKSTLSMLSSITQTSISNYEAGKQLPRPDAITKLANALSVPEAFFFKPLAPPLESPVFFRSFTRQKKVFQEQWAQQSAWLEELLNIYLQYIDLPELKIHQITLGENWESVPSATIEDIAYRTRAALGLGYGAVPNMIKLMENSGCVVLRVDMDPSEFAFSRWLLGNRVPCIFVTSETTACRDRMSVAHELGHLVMHRNITLTDKNRKIVEDQANVYASAFLMPEMGYAKDLRYTNLDGFKSLKKKWGVSISAQIMRCSQLNIIPEKIKHYLYIHLSKKGWRTNEPFDDEMPLETPNLLNAATKMLISSLGVTKEDISTRLGLSFFDIARLSGTPIDYFIVQDEDVQIIPKAKRIYFNRNR